VPWFNQLGHYFKTFNIFYMNTKHSNLPFIELRSVQSEFPKVKISDSEKAADFIRQFYSGDIDIFESSFILLLNRQNLTIGFAKLSQGGINSTIIDPRIVAHYAVKALATSVILCHNHPSGNLQPSDNDLALTKKVHAGLQLLDINLLDHIILTSAGYHSILNNEGIS
jgi:DNA repair protein RadC